MGQAVTRVYSSVLREVKMFNIEKRAEKVISKEKPTVAPMYPSTVKELDRLKEENVSKEYLHVKNKKLDDHLKKVFVTSPDPAPPVKKINHPDRPLPQSRHSDVGLSYGYSESEEKLVPEGRITLKQALQFIADHQADPQIHNNSAISAQYKLEITATDDILEHFKMFDIRLKKEDVDPEKLPYYKQMQLKVHSMTMYNAEKVLQEYNLATKRLKGESTEKEEINDPSIKEVKPKNDTSSNNINSKKNS